LLCSLCFDNSICTRWNIAATLRELIIQLNLNISDINPAMPDAINNLATLDRQHAGQHVIPAEHTVEYSYTFQTGKLLIDIEVVKARVTFIKDFLKITFLSFSNKYLLPTRAIQRVGNLDEIFIKIDGSTFS